MKRLKLIIVLVMMTLLVACSGGSSNTNQVDAHQISYLMNSRINRSNAYNGMVVAQQTKEFQKDTNKVIKEILVKEGDVVSHDTVLFTYDTDAMNVEVQKAALDIERMNNEILNNQAQINNLYNEAANAPASQQLSYSIEIQTLQASINETNYNIRSKQVELDRLNASLLNAEVVAEIEGVVQKVAPEGMDAMGQPSALITILQTGNFRVKGNVNEMNISQINPGQPVIIRSRLDNTQTWTGSIDKIETNSPSQGQNNWGMPSDEMSQSSTYPFYVVLNDTEGLFLGQHVYIELDQGQGTPKEGVWIPMHYLGFSEEGEVFVYKVDSNQKTQKAIVEMGMMDDLSGEVEILSGLTSEDYIVIPTEDITENLKVNLVTGE